MWVVNGAEMQYIDQTMIQKYRYPGLLLMETAGRKSAEALIRRYPHIRSFLIACGPGNNGGDGLVTARYLALAGREPLLVLSHPPEKFKDETALNFEIIQQLEVPYFVYRNEEQGRIRQFLSEGAVIVDALLGIGTKGKLQDPVLGLLNFLRSFRQSVVALDIPTGLSPDLGGVDAIPLRCECTLTYHRPKICHYITPASNFCGAVELIDIGIYPKVMESMELKIQLLTPEIIKSWYIPREADKHKGTFGHVFFAGGSKGKGGAIALTANAATEVGAGLCTAFIPGSVASSFHRTTLENMSVPYGTPSVAYLNETSAELFTSYLSDKAVVGIGPGLGNTPDTVKFFRAALSEIRIPLILDADALNILAENPDIWQLLPRNTPIILTPHPGEMSRLMNLSVEEIQQSRLQLALQLAQEKNVIVVLKGAGTIITNPNGNVFISSLGNPGMATGGSGDVLTGVIGGLIAQGYEPFKAAALGVNLHAASGDFVMEQYGHEGVTATKIIRNLGSAFKRIRESVSPNEADF